VPESLIIEARDELAQLLKEQAKAKLSTNLLTKEKNELEINL